MIEFKEAETEEELLGILSLQQDNIPQNLSPVEIETQGFVTVQHSLEQLRKMNSFAKHIIAKDGEKVVAYTLAMTKDVKNDIPILVPMFQIFNEIEFNQKKLSEQNYIVVGQACVAKNYRGMNMLDQCYQYYKKIHQPNFDLAITEIDARNPRSLRAHEKTGFQNVHTYQSTDGKDWIIVVWNWKA